MANKERGELDLRAGDATYTMRLTTNAICEMETASGRTFGQIVGRIRDESFSDARLFIWASLRDKHPKLTPEDVGTLIDKAGGIKKVGGKLLELITLNMGNNGEPENPPAPAPTAGGTGGSSTSTPDA